MAVRANSRELASALAIKDLLKAESLFNNRRVKLDRDRKFPRLPYVDRAKAFEDEEKHDGNRDAQVLIPFPNELAEQLPGSIITAKEFLATLGEKNIDRNVPLLLGESAVTEDFAQAMLMEPNMVRPMYHYPSEDGNININVYNGSTNNIAIELSEIADKLFFMRQKGAYGEEYDKLRLEYQKKVATIMLPILKRSRASVESGSEKVLEINEDCIATGDSIVGLLTMLQGLGIDDIKNKQIKINVAVATGQGILILKQFAEENGFNLEINAGYLAYGLYEGIQIPTQGTYKEAWAHSNYIIYTPEVLEQIRDKKMNGPTIAKSLEKKQFVVGDMGDWVKSLSDKYDVEYPPNRHRVLDPHGDRGVRERYETAFQDNYDRNANISLYLANGGYFTRSLMAEL